MPNRPLILASLRRASNANSDGSLRENMAKADIRASANGTVALALRRSGIARKPLLTKAYKESADKVFLAFLVFLSGRGGGRIMALLLTWGLVIVLVPLYV